MRGDLKRYLKTGDAEQLHALRVEVKKLRAMLILLKTVTHRKHLLKMFRPARKLFKQAGDIRSAQINLQLADEFNLHNAEFNEHQQQLVKRHAERFKMKAPKMLKRLKRAHRLIKPRLPQVSGKSVADFYNKQLKQIAGSLAVPHFDDELHNCRKQLKVLMYNYKLTADAIAKYIKLNEQYVDDLQSNIGEWHDKALALELFASPQADDQPAVVKLKEQGHRAEQAITELSRNFMIKVIMPALPEPETKSV